MSIVVICVGGLFFAGHFLNWFFEKTRLPDVLVLMLVGFLLGPEALGLVQVQDLGQVGHIVATITLIVILYACGLNLNIKKLLEAGSASLALSIVSFLLMGAAGFVLARFVALQSFETALLFGVGIGSTSSAVVIPMAQVLPIGHKAKTILSLESAFTDVLSLVFFLVFLKSFTAGHFDVQHLIGRVGPDSFRAVLLGLGVSYVWAGAQNRFEKQLPPVFSNESMAIILYGITDLMHLSGPLSILSFGFGLANLGTMPGWFKKIAPFSPWAFQKSHTMLDNILLAQVSLILRSLFFLYLGIIVHFKDQVALGMAMATCVLIYITRLVACVLLFNPKNTSRQDAFTIVTMGPRGLACAVLALMALQSPLPGKEWLHNSMVGVVPLSILITSVLIFLGSTKIFEKIVVRRLFRGYKSEC